MGNFTPISRRPAKCAMKTACAHSGALQGDVMEHFAGQREISAKFPMRAAARPEIFQFCVAGGHAKLENFGPSVTSKSKETPKTHTTHAPDYMTT